MFVASLGRKDVRVHSNKGDGFGRLVSVDAPKEVWEEAWVLLAREMACDFYFDEIEEHDGSLWGRTRGVYSDDDDEITELIYQQDGQTELQLVQDGYIPVAKHNGRTLWMKCQEIAKTT
jgi:hypothetical protein